MRTEQKDTLKKNRKEFGRGVIALLSVVGTAIMGYLTYLHFSPEEGSFCNLGERLSCDVVNKSIYSEVFGVPLSVMGVVFFWGVLVAVLKWYNKGTLKYIAFFAKSLRLLLWRLSLLHLFPLSQKK